MDEYILVGDIFLTRHGDEDRNVTPGYWNHAAIYIGDLYSYDFNQVVEAQEGPGKVIVTNYPEFIDRYPEIIVLRMKDSNSYAVGSTLVLDMALEAKKLIGSSYRKVASVFRFLRRNRRGENCVSVVRKAFQNSMGFDPKWKLPDDIRKDERFRVVFRKGVP